MNIINSLEQKRQCIYFYYSEEIKALLSQKYNWTDSSKSNSFYKQLFTEMVEASLIKNNSLILIVNIKKQNANDQMQFSLFDIISTEDVIHNVFADDFEIGDFYEKNI
jgi:hypothetical protein